MLKDCIPFWAGVLQLHRFHVATIYKHTSQQLLYSCKHCIHIWELRFTLGRIISSVSLLFLAILHFGGVSSTPR
jgi:hypothetical protein